MAGNGAGFGLASGFLQTAALAEVDLRLDLALGLGLELVFLSVLLPLEVVGASSVGLCERSVAGPSEDWSVFLEGISTGCIFLLSCQWVWAVWFGGNWLLMYVGQKSLLWEIA